MPRVKGTCPACRNAVPYDGQKLSDHDVSGKARHNSVDASPRCAGSYRDSVETLNAPRPKPSKAEERRQARQMGFTPQ